MKNTLLAVFMVSILSLNGCVAMMKSTVHGELSAILVEAENNGTCELLFDKVQKFIDEKLK